MGLLTLTLAGADAGRLFLDEVHWQGSRATATVVQRSRLSARPEWSVSLGRVPLLSNVALDQEVILRSGDAHEKLRALVRLFTHDQFEVEVQLVLEREEAIAKLRELVGATDPAEAADGTIRQRFGVDKGHNAVHASDAPETAEEEIAFFGLTLDRDAR